MRPVSCVARDVAEEGSLGAVEEHAAFPFDAQFRRLGELGAVEALLAEHAHDAHALHIHFIAGLIHVDFGTEDEELIHLHLGVEFPVTVSLSPFDGVNQIQRVAANIDAVFAGFFRRLQHADITLAINILQLVALGFAKHMGPHDGSLEVDWSRLFVGFGGWQRPVHRYWRQQHPPAARQPARLALPRASRLLAALAPAGGGKTPGFTSSNTRTSRSEAAMFKSGEWAVTSPMASTCTGLGRF